ncbi:MAG: hypothetical protein NZM25_10155 [Leptospiraceae bacterium]|nr:hypothetical protein [Leptospiraceae bacterium]MDW8307512.1 hypothetical protein [Leptospiraceae bacterium]
MEKLREKAHFLEELASRYVPSIEREKSLRQLSDYIESQKEAQLVFVCSLNSRRSVFAQAFMQLAADYLMPGRIRTFSGGNQVTEIYPTVVETLRDFGFLIEDVERRASNTVYRVFSLRESFLLFSKKYSDGANPQSHFAAVLVCSTAEKECPFVPNADSRISLPYDDPKNWDNTPEEKEAYRKSAEYIATEMFWTLAHIKNPRS